MESPMLPDAKKYFNKTPVSGVAFYFAYVSDDFKFKLLKSNQTLMT